MACTQSSTIDRNKYHRFEPFNESRSLCNLYTSSYSRLKNFDLRRIASASQHGVIAVNKTGQATFKSTSSGFANA